MASAMPTYSGPFTRGFIVADTKMVSVIVPLYNGAEHIGETLLAVAAQQQVDVEIIVVDDASTDDSVQRVLDCGVTVTLLRQAKGGVCAARNAGLARSRGEVVCFLDQDDIWYPDHLQTQLRCFESHAHAGAVVSPYQHWYADATSGQYPAPQAVRPPPPAEPVDAEFSGWVFHQFLLDCWALTSATMIRREVLSRVGGFDPTQSYGEDWHLWLRLSREVPFIKLNGPPVLYRQHPSQGSRQARPIDHRTQLLLDTAAQHGYASRDGRAVERGVFERTVARYEMEFGCHHLAHGDPRLGQRALWRAWRRHPSRVRYLALALAAEGGWRGATLQQGRGASRRVA